MHETNINSLDLNLLVALKALLDERHVTRAAEKVGLSQPAMSRALGRLRIMFKDPLLVKGKGGMELSSRASELYRPLQTILSEIGELVSLPEKDPALMQGEIVIATRDYEMVAVLPDVIERVSSEAPGLRLKIVPLSGDDLSPLENNEVDFVIAGTDKSSASLKRRTLFKDNFIGLVSAKNPICRQDLSLAKYLQMKHCLVSINEHKPGLVDSMLAQQGQKRKVLLRVPHFLAASHLVASSDLIVTLPRRLAMRLSESRNLQTIELPFKLPSFSIFLYWNVRNQNNPVHNWLQKVIKV